MSNIFRHTKYKYGQIPEFLFTSGALAKLRVSSLRMYAVLLYEAQRSTRVELTISNHEFRADTGLSSNSLKQGRDQLVELKLIRAESSLGGAYTLTLCDPFSGEPLPNPHPAKKALGTAKVPARAKKGLRPVRKADSISAREFIEELTPEQVRDFFENRLQQSKFTRSGDGFMARCPFHADSKPSLKIDFETAQWFCHAGCGGSGLVGLEQRINGGTGQAALMRIAEFFGRRDLVGRKATAAEAIYNYPDEYGKLLFQSLKLPDKEWALRRPDPANSGRWIPNLKGVRRVLYCLPEVVQASTVGITEGEKDADRLRKVFSDVRPQFAATTNPLGAGHWRSEYSSYLKDKHAILFADNDEPGRNHAEDVAASVFDYASEVRVVHFPDLPEHGDVSDYLDSHSREELVALIDMTPIWQPVGQRKD